ncbi:MAG: phosphoheptose isomerase [Lentisphaerae bacterium GWF2_52_8]|nr:MAG: phosphoheptose isomerase [Lentisphaerae bacterium GWF2_52_8]
MEKFLDSLFSRYPALTALRPDIIKAYSILEKTFCNGGTLFVCGNGGSAADSEHIVGELMKGFLKKRPLKQELCLKIRQSIGEEGKLFEDKLQRGLRAISLTGHVSLSTAFSNDIDGSLVFAQQLLVLSKENDALLTISTSGNSVNVVRCMQLAKVLELETITLTGSTGGKSALLADCSIKVPETETYKVQEYHLPIYHTLCMMLEERFYGESD